jgi:hypothetical protein
MIFLLVSIRELIPISTLSMVNGESSAFLASSDLLMRSCSLILFTKNQPWMPRAEARGFLLFLRFHICFREWGDSTTIHFGIVSPELRAAG